MNRLTRDDGIAIIAEIAQSYEGDFPTLIELSQKVSLQPVDGVMFQVVYADELAVPANKNYPFFKTLEFSKAQWRTVIEAIHQNGGKAVGEVFGRKSLDIVAEAGADAVKIHTSDLANLPLLRYVREIDLPVMLGVGGSYDYEIDAALNHMQGTGTSEIVLMHGYQLCPTTIEDSNLLKMRALAERYRVPVGYSDHIAGCLDGDVSQLNPLAPVLPVLALGAGAKLIEKHVIADRTKAWEDYESALTPEELGSFITLINTLFPALGSQNIAANEAELAYRMTAKKFIVASQDLQEGTLISQDHLSFKRIANPAEGIVNLDQVVGKRLSQAVLCNDVIKVSHLI